MGDVCKPCLEKVEEQEEPKVEERPKRPKKGVLAKLAAIALLLLFSASTAAADVTPIPLPDGNRTVTPCYVYVVEKPVPYYVTVTKTVTKTVTRVKYMESPSMAALAVVVPLLAALGALAGNIFSKRQAEEVKEL